MISKRSLALVSTGLVAGLALGGTVVAVAATSTSTVKVCTTRKGAVRSASKSSACPAGTKKRSINVAGPQGPQGAPGPAAIRINQTITPPAVSAAITGTTMTVNCNPASNHLMVNTQTAQTFYGSYRTSAFPNGGVWRRENNLGSSNIIDDAFITMDLLEVDPASGKTTHVTATVVWFSGVCRVHGVVTPAA